MPAAFLTYDMDLNHQPSRLVVKFWGVRGSTPTPQPETMGYGGNTPCIEVRGPGNDVFIFDGGTGLRQLGAALQAEFQERKLRIHFFSTHCHWDHIQGIPFFAPLYQAEHEITFYSSATSPDFQQVLAYQMRNPYFPVDFRSIPIRWNSVPMDGEDVKCDGLSICAFPVNHPQGAVAYRIESAGASVVYATDLENGDARLDSILRDHADGADILIHDAQYTPEEYQCRRGWGHSSWDHAVSTARDANVKRLILFHHDPAHDDDAVSAIVEDARRHVDHAEAAREGWALTL